MPSAEAARSSVSATARLAKRIAEWVGCSHPTAVKLALDFQARGWLKEVTGFERNRAYQYQPYTDLVHRESVESAFEAQHGLVD